MHSTNGLANFLKSRLEASESRHRKRSRAIPASADRIYGWVPRAYADLLLASAMWGFSAAVFTMLPTYMTDFLHATEAAVGWVSGIFALVIVATAPLSATVAARYSTRTALGATAIAFGLMSVAFVAVESVGPLLVGLRVVQAICCGLAHTIVGVAVIRLIPAQRLSQALGLSGVTMLAMQGITPMIVEPLVRQFSWTAAFVLATATAFGAMGLALRLKATPRLAVVDKEAPSSSVRHNNVVRVFAYSMFAGGVTFGIVMTFEQTWASTLGAERIAGFFAGFAIAAIITRVGFGYVPDRFGRKRVGSLAMVAYGLSAGALAVAPVEWFSLIGFAFGVTHGFAYPALSAMAITSVPPSARAKVMAIFGGSFHLGVASMGFVGWLVEPFGYGVVFLIAATAAISAGGLLYVTRSPSTPSTVELTFRADDSPAPAT